jgi:LAS superfamily LD-carboxypeptidase LdcB
MIRALVVVLGIALLAPSAPVRAERLVDYEQVVDLTPYDTIGYRRGRRVKIKVVQIGWAEVEVKTAKAFLTMQAAAAEDGIGLYIRSGFRSHEIQQWLYQAYKEGYGNKAARPGFSNHQSGSALDIYLPDPATLEWLNKHGRRFGFKRTVKGEPWHWEYTKPPKKKSRRKHR